MSTLRNDIIEAIIMEGEACALDLAEDLRRNPAEVAAELDELMLDGQIRRDGEFIFTDEEDEIEDPDHLIVFRYCGGPISKFFASLEA
jgi:hypothetical protein